MTDEMHRPSIGETYTYPSVAGLTWRAVAQEPYTRLDGTASIITVWESYCKTCQMPFTAKSGSWTKPPQQLSVINCPTHRGTVSPEGRAAQRIGGRKGRAILREIRKADPNPRPLGVA